MKATATAEDLVCRIIGQALPGAPLGAITPALDLHDDLGVDSIGLMSIVFLLEEEIGFDAFVFTQDFVAAQSVADIVAIARRAGDLR